MDNSQLDVQVTDLIPFSVARLDGAMTYENLKNLIQVVNRIIDEHAQPYIIIDLSGIESVVCSWASAIIYLQKTCKDKHGELVVVRANNPIVRRALYEATRSKDISFFDDLITAADITAEKLGLPKPCFP